MNVLAHRALLADHERSRRARFREVLLRELPGIEVGEAGDLEELVRTLERAVFGLTRVRHPPGADTHEPAGLNDRSPEPARPLSGPAKSEGTKQAAGKAGDPSSVESGMQLPGPRATVPLALARMRRA